MFTIFRDFSICYGHRLLNYDGKCAHLHGHNGKIRVFFSSEKLDSLGMVLDFGDVKKKIGDWLDATIDHRMILCESDPLVPILLEHGEPLFLIPVNPTAENLAELVFDFARKIDLPVVKVEFWETEKSCAIYSESPIGI